MKKFLGILILGIFVSTISSADDLKIIDGDTIVLNGGSITALTIFEITRKNSTNVIFLILFILVNYT